MKAQFKTSCAIAAILTGWAGMAVAADSGEASSGVEEITVTATRRSESIQDVPSTIQAFSGESLSKLNITSFSELIKHTPNVTFGSNGPGAGNIFMRGLSSGFAGNQSSAAIGAFPNVAVYLDDQSMTFPARNVDVYVVDMERLEVLEGPQGTLFGGGAEAGAIRYITNKPNVHKTEGFAEASVAYTEGGATSYSVNATYNIPVIEDKFALRATIYNDRRGGYIDNIPSTFTRKPTDTGPSGYSSAYPANVAANPANNYTIAAKNQNPTTYSGFRLSAQYDVNDEWSVLIQQSFQNLDAEGMSFEYPTGSDGQALKPLQVTSFVPMYDKDRFWNTSWTVNGQFGDIKAVYTGAFLSRHIDQTMDYTNYARVPGGFYYQCVGGPAGASNIGAPGPSTCYSPISSWHDYVESTHQSHELRLSTPDDWRVRGILGGFYEDFDIKDDMNFLYKTIPSCTPAALAAFQAGGALCLGNVAPAPGTAVIDPTGRNDNTAYGEDQDRGYKQEAVFGSIDYDIIPKVLTVTGGTRYYHYSEFLMGSLYSTGAKCIGLMNGTCYAAPLLASDHAAHYSGFKSRANVTWHIDPDAMVYYTYSEGFRPGAGNRQSRGVVKINTASGTVAQFTNPFTYKPDSLTNHEVGFKGQFFEHRLLLNASAYLMHWNDVQTLIYNPSVFGNATFGVNGPNYEIKGLELQFVAKVTDQMTLDGSFSYNDSKETNSPCIQSSFVAAAGKTQNPTPLGTCITQVYDPISKANVPLINPLGAVGATPAFSPKVQFNVHARYDWDMDSYNAFATVGVSYTGSMNNEPSSFQSGVGVAIPNSTYLRFNQPAYATVDAAFGVSKGNWQAQIYGTNLNNSHASTFTTTAQFIKAELPLRPMVVGLKLGSKF